jgi:peroxiredoxin
MDSSEFRIRLRTIYLTLVATTLAIVVIIGVKVSSLEQNSLPSSPLVGKKAPDFTLPTLDGTEVSLSQFHGRPALINFWATWCLPCREEMPELVRSYEAHKSEGFMILGLNLTYSDTLLDVQAFVSEFHITFPVLLDKEGKVAEMLYPLPGVPTSIFINRDGTIERVQVGLMSEKQIDKFVAEILR